MNIAKSLLTAFVAGASSLTAAASPVSVSYPVPGSSLDNRDYFASFNIDADGAYTVASDARATLECLETGDMIECTSFADFMGIAIVVRFDSEDIADNGEYEFVVYPGSVLVNGEPNEKIVANYTLSDPSLAAGTEFPQISLVSSNPADGASVAAFGENSISKATFSTDNDAAVNYIGWELWNVTDPAVPEWMSQGSENRIDPNRNGGKDIDQWEDGLFVSFGGVDRKLIKGQKYELRLVFCGVGYDPVTKQYPNSISIEKSKELETSLFFNGLTEPTEYSPYVYENVSPDPSTYEIETIEQARFTITYSGPVKPETFTFHRDITDNPVAGTFTALGEPDADGYAAMWEFAVFPELANDLGSRAHFNITASDRDGLPVKGNGGFPLDDYIYSLEYECSVGLPDLVSVAPEQGAVVESLSEIIVSNAPGLVMNYGWNALEPARICDMFGSVVRTLDIPVAVEDQPAQMKWTFDPIADSGNYVLIIPKWYFAIGEEFEGTSNKLTNFMYVIENGSVGGAAFDLVPVSVVPADGASVSEIANVVLTFGETTFYPQSADVPTATLFKVEGDVETEVAVSEPAVDNDFFNPTSYTFTFSQPVKDAGTYLFKVARGSFCDATFDEQMGEGGHANDDLVYTFIVGGAGVESVAVGGTASVIYSIDGRVVARNASSADFNALPAGVYIVGGRKVVKY